MFYEHHGDAMVIGRCDGKVDFVCGQHQNTYFSLGFNTCAETDLDMIVRGNVSVIAMQRKNWKGNSIYISIYSERAKG